MSNRIFNLGMDALSCADLVAFSQKKGSVSLVLSPEVAKKVMDHRRIVEEVLEKGEVVYGINTGFGFLAQVQIEERDLEKLQVNLIRSHACGVGSIMAPEMARALLLQKIHSLSFGASGISLECLNALIALFSNDILPIIPEEGSVGASGDLAPLAHLGLTLLGEGDVYYAGEVMAAEVALKKAGLTPYQPKAKEGLGIINGTQFMSTLGAYALTSAWHLAKTADMIAALSLDAMRGSISPFDARIHAIRPHPGQIAVGENFLKLFNCDDAILASHKDCTKVQDAYSFRCIPQVHGAVRGALLHIKSIFDCELNSCTDNPLVFENGDVISGGNFHGEPLAMGLDYLGIAVSELASISERRIEKMTNPAFSDLPAFLVKSSGLNSGFMIPHVTAAALASENKVLAHPASVDSIPTSADKEDHVSMGPIAARKALKIINNTAHVLAVELICAAQGIDLLSPLKPGKYLASLYDHVRKTVPSIDDDRPLYKEISLVSTWIKSGELLEIPEIKSLSLE